MNINKTEIKKILCIKPRGIGDIVLSTIVLENLESHFPSAEIHYLTESFAKDAVLNNPMVSKAHTMEEKEFVIKVANRLRKEHFNLIFDLWSNPRSAQITFLTGAKYRVGFAYRGRKYAYNLLAESGRGKSHSAEHNLNLLKVVDVPIISKNIHYYVGENEKHFADKFFKDKFSFFDNIIGIIPSGGWESKRCDAAKWVEICEALKKIFNYKFLILWGPGDENDATFIKTKLGDDCTLALQSSVAELAGLINKCSLIIANDSGPMHISAALGIPTLGIFGPTDPEKHGPYSANSDYIIKKDLHCIICNKLICPFNHECMLDLSVSEIAEKTKRLLGK